jgi:hypothetical protein
VRTECDPLSVNEYADEFSHHLFICFQASLRDKYSNVIFQGNLLDRLPNWLDRLFEGTTHRYYINYWPDFAPK